MKGFLDLMLMVSILLSMVLGLVILAIVSNKIFDALDSVLGSNAIIHTMLVKANQLNWTMVNIIPLGIIGIWLGAIFAAWILPSHPVFLVLWLVFAIVMELVVMAVTNVMWIFLNTDLVSPYTTNFLLLYYFVKYFPYIFPALSGIYAVILYGRIGSEVGTIDV